MANVNDNAESAKSQNAKILEYLNNGNTLTALEALKMFGCMRLASRIIDLRESVVSINKKKVGLANGKYVTQYSIDEYKQTSPLL